MCALLLLPMCFPSISLDIHRSLTSMVYTANHNRLGINVKTRAPYRSVSTSSGLFRECFKGSDAISWLIQSSEAADEIEALEVKTTTIEMEVMAYKATTVFFCVTYYLEYAHAALYSSSVSVVCFSSWVAHSCALALSF